MFYLKIQSTDKPGNQSVIFSKIGRCFELVNCPGIFHCSARFWREMFWTFYHVCQLKDSCNDQAGNHVHQNKSQQNNP